MAPPEISEFLCENTIFLSMIEKITHLAPLVLKISLLDPRLQKAIYSSVLLKAHRVNRLRCLTPESLQPVVAYKPCL